MKRERLQLSFAAVVPDLAWPERRPRPAWRVLTPTVSEDLRAFEQAVVEQGIAQSNSARTWRKAMSAICKQVQRFTGELLKGLSEVYADEILRVIARDDRALDDGSQLSRYTVRQRRVVLKAYLRAVGLPGVRFEEAVGRLEQAFRSASRRMGYRLVLGVGRPETRDCPVADEHDLAIVRSILSRDPSGFAGARMLAVLALGERMGLRSVSIEHLDGTDFHRRRGRLWVRVREKAVRGKRAVDEREVPQQAIPYLEVYVERFATVSSFRGRSERIGFGVPGPFFRTCDGRRRWSRHSLEAAYRRLRAETGVGPVTSHALRRRFGSGLAAHLSPHDAAIAGNWSVAVLLRHYARSRFRFDMADSPVVRPSLDGLTPVLAMEEEHDAHASP